VLVVAEDVSRSKNHDTIILPDFRVSQIIRKKEIEWNDKEIDVCFLFIVLRIN